MMSKKQWCVLLCLLIVYLLLGAWFYDEIETRDEGEVRALALEELKVIEELIHKHYVPNIDDTEDDILDKLADYCGKPMRSNTTDIENPAKWDFYHSLFFVITVVTTIGYGNLAPTTPFGRIAMIFYALIGIPISGICMVTLGDFFGKSFTKIYQRWKTKRMENDTTSLSLIAQIALYLIPGFTFFIFIPSVVIMMFEDWPYDVAVYYAFVTLTTIGFGDYVAGVNRPGTDSLIFTVYKLFLLIWIISGLGYVVMVMGFISRGLRSKKMHDIEHALAMNIKKTPLKIRNELRSLLREFVLQKIKSTYRQEFVYTPVKRDRSQSCPDLTIYRNLNSPTMVRKRALSECAYCTGLSRFESVSETNLVENEPLTLRRLSQQSNLLLQVANALGGLDSSESNSESEDEDLGGIHGFSDEEILASERFGSGWNLQNHTLSAVPPKMMRQRACSEIKFPFQENNGNNQKSDLTWYGPSATLKLQEIREKAKHGKPRSRTLPVQPTNFQTPNLYTRLKNTFIGPKQEEKASLDVESQTRNIPVPRSRLNSLAVDGNRRHRTTSESTSQYLKQTRGGRRSILPVDDRLLEQTSLADFIRALTAISVPEAESLMPQRKLGTASLTPPKQSPPKTRRFAIRPVQSRRTSLMPSTPTGLNPRRLSLRPSPVAENPAFLAPPPYTPLAPETTATRRSIRIPGSNRRFSLRPVTIFPNPSPVQRQVKKTKEKDELKEILNEKL